MADDPHSKKPVEFEIPDNLDEDPGDDWESAFQAEEFIFSEETTDEGFLPNNGTNDIDLSTLVEARPSLQPGKSALPETVEAAEDVPPPSSEPTDLPPSFIKAALVSLSGLLLALTTWYRARPVFQKVFIPALPLAVLIIALGFLFSTRTVEKLVKQTDSSPAPAALLIERPPEKKEQALFKPPPPPPHKQPAASEKTFQKKWSLPAFFIVAGEGDSPSLFVSIDLTLILQLGSDKELPEERLSFIRDTIFQFYRNRPAYELKQYALARGEMIRQLNKWIKKEWPDSPVSTIMFNKYQVIS